MFDKQDHIQRGHFRLSPLSSQCFSQKSVDIKYDETSATCGLSYPASTIQKLWRRKRANSLTA